MSTDFEPEDEQGLQELFDRTANEPDELALQRMARKAAQIPETRRAPWYRSPWVAGAAAVAAAVALYVGLPASDDGLTSLFTSSPTTTASTTSPLVKDVDQELLVFDIADDVEEVPPNEVALDADPLTALEGGDDVMLASDNPLYALDLLFVDAYDEPDVLGGAFDDVLTEGG